MFNASFTEKLFALPWFSQCGKHVTMQLPFSCSQVSSWAQASALSSALDWENTTLEARNELTDSIRRNKSDQKEDWNEITRKAKAEIVFPLAEKYWKYFSAANGLGKSFIDCVQWDILTACMEHAYNCPQFFTELLRVYSAGHFPCGWASGEYPSGQLLIW